MRQARGIARGPRLHPHLADIVDPEGGETRLQFAEHDPLLDEAVMRAVILLRQRPVAKRPVFALEPAGKGRRRPLDRLRIHHAVHDQRSDAADAVGTRQPRVADRLERPFGPPDPRMVGTKRESKIELREIQGHHVIQCVRLDRVEPAHRLAFPPPEFDVSMACGRTTLTNIPGASRTGYHWPIETPPDP